MKTIMCAVVIALFGTPVMAQGYTVFTPGQPRTFIHENSNGGYTVFTPGQDRTFVSPPHSDGSRTVFTPGQPRTFISPYGK